MPSKYVPYHSPAYAAQLGRVNRALEQLCSMERPAPLSQGEIARACNISQQHVAIIERRARRKLREKLSDLGITKEIYKGRGFAGLL